MAADLPQSADLGRVIRECLDCGHRLYWLPANKETGRGYWCSDQNGAYYCWVTLRIHRLAPNGRSGAVGDG